MRSIRLWVPTIALLLPLTVAGQVAWAWHAGGHQVVAQAAVRLLPKEMPEFFRVGAGELDAGRTIAHVSLDPDVAKSPATPQYAASEQPEHYIDVELLQGNPLPASRAEYLKLLNKLGLEPKQVGLLPYALTEWTQRLTLAFAEYRKYPENPAVKAKCLVYAGILAHYAADACQPLHLTIDFDGRADPKTFRSPRSGIHDKTDGLIERLNLDPATIFAAAGKVEALPELFPGIVKQIEEGRKHIDRLYALETKLPGKDVPPDSPDAPKSPESSAQVDAEVRAFALERAAAAAQFTAQLYLTAWTDSAKVSIPDWQDRARTSESK